MYSKKYLLIIALILVFQLSLLIFTDIKFFEDDEWTFYFSAENFSKGRFSLTDSEYKAQRALARIYSARYNTGNFTQYRQRNDGFWVSEKPAGYPLILSIFHRYNAPRLPNIILLILMPLSVFLLKNEFFNERERFYTAVLVIVCPLVLISSSRFYMVDFFSFSLTVIGFSCFLSAVSYQNKQVFNCLLSFISGISLSLSSFARIIGYGNVFIIIIFILFFSKKAGWKKTSSVLLFFLLGIFVFLLPNAVYNYRVLGNVLQNPYHVGDMPLKIPKNCFSFQYFINGDPPYPFLYIFRNIITSPQIIFLAMPAIMFMLAGIYIFYKEKDRRVLVFLLLVFASIFALFIQFYRVSTVNYLWNGRPYLQGFFPVAVFSAVFLSWIRSKIRIILLFMLIFSGYCLFFDFLYNNHQDPYYLGIEQLWNMDQRTKARTR